MVATFDFSTLYSALPHDDPIYHIVTLFNEYFNSNLEIRYNNKKLISEKSDLVNILNFCIDNSFVVFNNSL